MKVSLNFCQLCGKRPQVAFNRPKSQHKTKRQVLPNLQKYGDLVICSRCRRTIKKYVRTAQAA